MGRLGAEIRSQVRHGSRLEWWTIFWMSTVVVLIYLVMGSSQAMKAAWFEDMLGLVPAAVYLISRHWEKREPNRFFRWGFRRVNSLAFLVASVALLAVGAFLAFESIMALLKAEHPTIGSVRFFGETIWLGWLMIGVLVYSAIVPAVLGGLKLPVARQLQDKVLHTNALMQKADWMTALAAVAGIVGVGFGLWWADAAAALLISLSILRDGSITIRQSVAELADGVPRKLENSEIAEDAAYLEDQLLKHCPGAYIRMRESGRYILAEIAGVPVSRLPPWEELMPEGRAWRLASVTFTADDCSKPSEPAQPLLNGPGDKFRAVM